MSRYGGEWKNERMVNTELKKLKAEREKRAALEVQLKYQKNILKVQEALPSDKRKLLKFTKVPIAEMKKNLIEFCHYHQ